MRLLKGSLLAAGTSMLLTGCLATQSQLKHVSDQQTAVLEQNSVPGFTNRTLGRLVGAVFTAFPQAAASFPASPCR